MINYLQTLRKSMIFKGIEDIDIISIIQCTDARSIVKKKNEYILSSGDKTEYMGIILSGSALILQEDIWGRRNIITKLEAGDSFAEAFASADENVSTVSVMANEDSEILLLSIDKVLKTCPSNCTHHTKLISNLVSVLAKKAIIFSEKIFHITQKNTREKLLSYLSSQAIKKSSLSFDIPYNRQQLADYLCVDRAAMSVELSKLQKEGLIYTNKSHFVIKVKI